MMSDLVINSMDKSLEATMVVQLILVIMIAAKNLHLIRVFENQGMLVQLLLTCLEDISPFLMIICYLMFVIF